MTQEYPQHLNPFAEDEAEVQVLVTRRRARPSLRDAWFTPPPPSRPAPVDVELRRQPRQSLPPPQLTTSPPPPRRRRFSLSKTLETGGGRLYATLSPAILRRFVRGSSKKESAATSPPPTRPPPPDPASVRLGRPPPPPSPGVLVRSRSQALATSGAAVDAGCRGSSWTLAGDGSTRHSFRPKKRKAPPPPTPSTTVSTSRTLPDSPQNNELRGSEEQTLRESEDGAEGTQPQSAGDQGEERAKGTHEESAGQEGEEERQEQEKSAEDEAEQKDRQKQQQSAGDEGDESAKGTHDSAGNKGEERAKGTQQESAEDEAGEKEREESAGDRGEEVQELESFRKATLEPLRILEDDEPRPLLRRLHIDEDDLSTAPLRTRSPLPTPRKSHRHLVEQSLTS